jgi:hypothetical protein
MRPKGSLSSVTRTEPELILAHGGEKGLLATVGSLGKERKTLQCLPRARKSAMKPLRPSTDRSSLEGAAYPNSRREPQNFTNKKAYKGFKACTPGGPR